MRRITRLPSHVLNASQRMADNGTTFASYYLLSHGIVKLALVICLWCNKLWAYPLTIVGFHCVHGLSGASLHAHTFVDADRADDF